MGSAYLETPTFGGPWCPQIKLQINTNYISNTQIEANWELFFDGNGETDWGEITAWFGTIDGGVDVTRHEVTYSPGVDDAVMATGSFLVDRNAESRNVYVWLSCDLSDKYYYGYHGESWRGDNAITGDWFGVNAIEPPEPPISISGKRSGTSIVAALVNKSTYADGTQIYIRQVGGEWQEFYNSTSGGPVSSYTGQVPSGITGSVQLMARNYGAGLYSEWCPVSNSIAVIGAPNPPTLLSPTDGTTFEVGSGIPIRWIHNPTDGTDQEHARVIVDGVETLVDGSVGEYTIPNTFAKDTTHTWSVKTRGASTTYSKPAQSRTFTVRAKPSVRFTVTSVDSRYVQSTMPITFETEFRASSSGRFSRQRVEVIELPGKVVFAKEFDTLTGSIGVQDVILNKNTSYKLRTTVYSSYGLSTKSASSNFSYIPLPVAKLFADAGEKQDGTAEILLRRMEAYPREELEISRVEIYREHDGEMVFIASVPASDIPTQVDYHFSLIDKYPPLNVSYSYVFAAINDDTSTMSTVREHLKVNSTKWFMHSDGGIIVKEWNPSGSWSVKRPGVRLVHYDGRANPVSYDGENIQRSYSIGFELLSIDEAREIARFIESGGIAFFRSCDGFCGWVSVEAQFSPKYTDQGHYGTVSLSMTQIYGDAR